MAWAHIIDQAKLAARSFIMKVGCTHVKSMLTQDCDTLVRDYVVCHNVAKLN